MGLLGLPLSEVRWAEMREVAWTQLIEDGLPVEMAELAGDLGACRGRPIRTFTMPMVEAGIAGLAIPFIDDDGIVFDPSLLVDATKFSQVIANELAHLLYPRWHDLDIEDYDEMEDFAAVLGPRLLRELPDDVAKTQPMVELALGEVTPFQTQVREGIRVSSVPVRLAARRPSRLAPRPGDAVRAL
jgi:hypothetical protein